MHDMHNSFPVAPVKRVVSDDELSPYVKELWQQVYPIATGKLKGGAKQEQVITDLHVKDHYVVHHKNLKLYLKHGLQIKEIHKVLEFDQNTWLKCYIDFNRHKKAKTAKQYLKITSTKYLTAKQK